MKWLTDLFSMLIKPAPNLKVRTKHVLKIEDPVWVKELKTILGKHESKDNSFLKKWLKRDDKTLGDPSKNPWCGDAVETALKLHLTKEDWPDSLRKNPYWARNWAVFGVNAPHIPYGAIVVFERKGGGGHVGFVVGISADGKFLYVLGGNQSDSVTIAPISIDRMIASRWPMSVVMSKTGLPVLAGGSISVNEA